ncbi:DUF488 domain-containing protein [Lentibacillus sp. JNUCC-1]|uniref:DUF488 domain-containing protein n=1 Tax=Lentibacillus sp. JNUCC-1 TaxID=2654513 RepID=UPI002F908919
MNNEGKELRESELINMEIYTIGHYSHSEAQFMNLLELAQIKMVVDIRAFPGSRKFPQFSKDVMGDWLAESGVGYMHIPELGGRRKTTEPVSPVLNAGWNNQSFHNYADYTLSADFQRGVAQLMKIAGEHPTVMCCAERHPARCHRLIISNWLVAHDWVVKHIIPHEKGTGELVPTNSANGAPCPS